MSQVDLNHLNDRNIPFPDRCIIAESFLKNSNGKDPKSCLFPRKNQYLFDWLTGSLLKFAKTDSPRPEIFLNTHVWQLFEQFAALLGSSGKGSPQRGGLKRPLMISEEEEFFNYTKSFDVDALVIKSPLLVIFQVSLSLLASTSESQVEGVFISKVIVAFLQQNQVSLPVSFIQVTAFIRSLAQSRHCLPPSAFPDLLRPTLVILSDVIIGGAANYKKTYPVLVKFCLEVASSDDQQIREIWIEFMKKSLFPREFIDELLGLLVSTSMQNLLKDCSIVCCDSFFPKSSTFQKTLFIELSSMVCSVSSSASSASSSLVFEAFLQSSGPKISRESGFNFFAFLLKRCLPAKSVCASSYFSQLTELISVLHSRGNEIYQQRNDQIYRDQSAVIEEILTSSLPVDILIGDIPFLLLLSLARLNFYLISSKLNAILNVLSHQQQQETTPLSIDAISFVVGMIELSSMANQVPILIETLLTADLPLKLVNDPRLQSALSGIFHKNLNANLLNQIYMILVKSAVSNRSALYLLLPLIKSISKIIDSVDSFDFIGFIALQRSLLTSSLSTTSTCNEDSLMLLASIVRWSPGKSFLAPELVELIKTEIISSSSSSALVNLIFTLKCKFPKIPLKISDDFLCECETGKSADQIFFLILKYLPVVSNDLRSENLRCFARWLLSDANEQICLKALKKYQFFEISSLQPHFLAELVEKKEISFIQQVFNLIPWEYLKDEHISYKFIQRFWECPAIISHLIQPIDHFIRVDLIRRIFKDDPITFIAFLLSKAEGELVSKCFQVEHSTQVISSAIKHLKQKQQQIQKNRSSLAVDLAKILRYCEEMDEAAEVIVVEFIETCVDPVRMIKQEDETLTIESLDALDIILEWLLNCRTDLVALTILSLPEFEHKSKSKSILDLNISIRCQALRCKFPARSDLQFIIESIEMATDLDFQSPVGLTFKKDLLALIRALPTERVLQILSSLLLSKPSSKCKIIFALHGINQLVQSASEHSFSLFTDHLNEIYQLSLQFEEIKLFLIVFKSIIQIKKRVEWSNFLISKYLGILRKVRQDRNYYNSCSPAAYYSILRLMISAHCRSHLIPMIVSMISEEIELISKRDNLEESQELSRVITELSSKRRGEIEPFCLLPIIHSFVTASFSSSGQRKPIQLAMNSLMNHLVMTKNILQFLSTTLIFDHEHRIILKSFIDEYKKFYKYSGRT